MTNLVVHYDPFAAESRLYVMEDGKNNQINVHSSLNELAEELLTLAYSYNCYDLKFHAPCHIISEIKRRINELEENKYSVKKITIEGI